MKREDLKSILYVDDEPDIREVVQMSLSLVRPIVIIFLSSTMTSPS